jgi:uncharacterized membrane protein
MNDKTYKEQLDDKIEHLSKEVEIPFEKPTSTWDIVISDWLCDYNGSWSMFWLLTILLIIWVGINSIQGYIFDPYPYMLYTLLLSQGALYSNVFVQMSTNRLMRYVLWILQQMYKSSKKTELSILLLHQKIDIVLEIIQERKEL